MIEQIIHQRRSVYPAQYTNTPIAKEDIEKLLAAAHQAPTHRKTQPWRFKVFYSQESRAELGEFLALTYRHTISNYSEFKEDKIRTKVTQSGCVIAVNLFRDPNERVPLWEETAAVAMAVQNMWLLCTELGLGCYWSTPKLRIYLDDHIDLAEGESCRGFFYIGHYDQPAPEPWVRNPLQDHVTWI